MHDAAPSATRDDVIVHLDHISKRYGRKLAVHDLTLSLRAGEIFAFLGPNGAGKTTTLKMTTGLLRPDTGSVTICGHSLLRDARAAKRHVAFVPDQPFLYDKLTGREFIQFTCDMFGLTAKECSERLQHLSARLDMDTFLDQLTESYSHAMKQRVALAAALIHAPRLLVVDEPIVGLDPRSIRVVKQLFREVADQGGAVFMSTHTLDVAEVIADRIGILHEGRFAALGTLAELRSGADRGRRLEDIFLDATHAHPSGGNGAPPR